MPDQSFPPNDAKPFLVKGESTIPPEAQPSCLLPNMLSSCGIVIFGASGDLAARKLVPALFNLFASNLMPDSFFILGVSRTDWDDDEFRQHMYEAIHKRCKPENKTCDLFTPKLFYQTLNYDETTDYQLLKNKIQALQKQNTTTKNLLFNLALPPSLPATVLTNLGEVGFSQSSEGWTRVVLEKPFGKDLLSAQKLNQAIAPYFSEDQIFRVDHYLAKETVQSLMMFRFANGIFEPLLNRNYVERVVIVASEQLGVEHRAGYYEQAGVLRDMFQNHMMQLMSLIAMEPPSLWAADRVRDEKTKIFRSLRPFDTEQAEQLLILGQYGKGNNLPAYREEPGVSPESLIPTFAMLKIFIDNWRWQGVPFVLVSGKRLAKKTTRMVIKFKQVPHSLFRNVLGSDIAANQLNLSIHPEETISLSFQTKSPGAYLCLRTVRMLFDYNEGYTGPVLGAYEKSLADCILGDQMLFWRKDGVELCWSFLDPILEQCETCGDRAAKLHSYPAGSWGPNKANQILSAWPKQAL